MNSEKATVIDAVVEKTSPDKKTMSWKYCRLIKIGGGCANTLRLNCGTGIEAQHNNVCIETRRIGQMKRSEIPDKFQRFTYEINGEEYLIRVRKLTPKTCWKLMGFTEEDFEKASQVCSDTQLYKQAGNSIIVQNIENIIKTML